MAVTTSAQNLERQSAANPPLTSDPRVSRMLKHLEENADAITEEQVRITEVPAPSFQEKERAAYIAKLLGAAGLRVETDAAGNVIGEQPGSKPGAVLLAAHLDTVFPAGTDVRVKREGGRLLAPGISDNGTGLAALVGIARALRDAKIKTSYTILFVADVGEEGEGNLRGMRALVEARKRQLKYVIALDGSATDYVTAAALASRRVEVVIEGPGGHSWSDFGTVNPVHAIARGVARFVKARVPETPRTTFNVGEIEGGTSVNSIPFRAAIKVDLRSESETELSQLESTLRESMKLGVGEEVAAARERGMVGGAAELHLSVSVLGIRPGGELSTDSPLMAAVEAADRQLGNRSRVERSSTDANIPLSLGIPAISLGGGGASGGAHSLNEWYEPAGRAMGLKRVALTLLAVAGVEP